jgi:hypothetical protein
MRRKWLTSLLRRGSVSSRRAEANRDVITHEEDSGKQRWMHYAELLGEKPDNSLFFVPFQAQPARKLSLVDADKISFESLRVIAGSGSTVLPQTFPLLEDYLQCCGAPRPKRQASASCLCHLSRIVWTDHPLLSSGKPRRALACKESPEDIGMSSRMSHGKI